MYRFDRILSLFSIRGIRRFQSNFHLFFKYQNNACVYKKKKKKIVNGSQLAKMKKSIPDLSLP